jgi:hypothetical protein
MMEPQYSATFTPQQELMTASLYVRYWPTPAAQHQIFKISVRDQVAA